MTVLAARARTIVVRRGAHFALAGVTAGLLVSPGPPDAALALAAASAAALAVVGAPLPGLLAAVLVMAGAAAGDARLSAIDRPGRELAAGARIESRAHLLERPRAGRFGAAAAVRLLDEPGAGAVLYARFRPSARLRGRGPGAELVLRGHVRAPPAGRRGGFDFAAYLRRRGIAWELAVASVRATGRARGGPAGTLDRARVRAERGVAAGLPAREAALARGIVLGQDEAIDPLLRNDFRASGLGHLLAVSGHNVMLLCALALPALAASGLGPGGRAAALVGIVAVYVPLAGAGPSLQRAGVMGVAGLVALGAGRVASRAYGLLLAAAATLALNPRVSGDPGWQLSFAAVAGILLLGRPLRAALGRAPPAAGEAGRLAAALRDGIAITLAATIATAPLLAHHFGSVPLAGLAANLAALPAVAPLMWLGLASAALAQLGPLALGPVELLGLPAGLLLRYLAWIATRFAEAGGVLSLRLSWPATAAAYGLLGGGLLAGRRAFRRARPRLTAMGGHWRLLPSGLRRGALAGSAGCLLAVAYLALLRPPAPPDRLTVSFLDVGQGDATLVQDGDGAAMLFDSGPPEARVERLLRRAGVRRLSALVATHASRDHHGGLVAVLRRYPVDLLVDGGDGTADPAFRAALAEADRRGVRRIEARAGLRLRAGGLRVVVLSPPPRPRGPPPEDPNGRAVIAVVAAGSFQLLLSADAESAALLPLALPDVDAMKVPHHGSADPGLPAVLARLRPEVAAIEVGADNPYGHPARSTLAALRAAVPHVYRTDRDGTVTLTVDGAGMRVSTAR